MINFHDKQVGDTVYFVTHQSRISSNHESTIEKIGRKWIHTSDGHRFTEDGRVDGGQYSSPGRMFPSKEAHEEKCRIETLRKEILLAFDLFRGDVDHLTESDLLEIKAIINKGKGK